MHEIGPEELSKIFKGAGMSTADPGLDMGLDLSFRKGPARVMVVYFDESDFPGLFRKTLEQIFSIEPCWLLIQREGSGQVLAFERPEFPDLIDRMNSHLPQLTHVGEDWYLMAKSGEVLVSFDHHLSEDGLTLSLSNVAKAGTLLQSLNEIGAELELFSERA